jgi:hypothetical protein
MPFSNINKVVFAVGRSTPNGVNLLGTAFLLNEAGLFATCAHVTDSNDQNLVIALKPNMQTVNNYQDTTDRQVQFIKASIKEIDPVHDLCVLETGANGKSNIKLSSTDSLNIADNVGIFGYPHADHGRMVLTFQRTEIGAKVLIESSGIKSKHIVLNIESRPGQSGGPVINLKDGSIAGIIIGSYAPTAAQGGISIGGIDPQTLHQTTHAISAEYLKDLL